MKTMTLAELERKLRLERQSQENLGDFTPGEREWFAECDELSAKAARRQQARAEAKPVWLD